MKKIVVASKNPVKINATKIAFGKMFPDVDFEVVGVSVPSGVNDQPLSSDETKRGAINRASNVQKEVPDADLWVGIEGGLEKIGDDMDAFAWIVIKSSDRLSFSRTASFFLPRKTVELINSGIKLGTANDILFQRTDSKQKGGAVGILTDGVSTRTSYYIEAVVLALIPFKHPELY